MSIFDRFRRGRKAATDRATFRDDFGWLITSLTYGPNPSGETVNERTALGIAAYFASIRNISEDVAKLPRKVYETKTSDTRSRKEDRAHRVRDLITNPNPHMTGFTFWQTILANALGYRAGYAEIVRNGLGDAVQLWPLDSSTVVPGVSRDGRELFYKVTVGGKETVIRSEDMFVIHGLGLDGYTGFSLAQVASTTLGSIQAGNTFRAAFFGNSLTPSGFFELPAEMSEPAVKNFNESMKLELRGAKKAHGAHVLPDGIKWNKGSIDPDKSQLLESGAFGIEEVARLFRMPPSKLQHMVNSSVRANIEQENTSYFVDTLSPWALRIEEEINRKLFSKKERGTHFVEHVFNALMLADATARHDALAKGFATGLYTINDMLKIENMPLIGPKGDVRFVPHNLKTLDEALAPPPEPTPKPEDPPREPEEPPGEPELEPKQRGPTEEKTLSVNSHELKPIWRLFRRDFRKFANIEEERAMTAMLNNRLDKWLKGFYPAHEGHVAKAITLYFDVLFTAIQIEADPEEMGRLMAKEYINESRERTIQGTRNEDIDTLDRFAGVMATRAVEMGRKAA